VLARNKRMDLEARKATKTRRERSQAMMIIGCDLRPRYHQIAGQRLPKLG
jgi:hypothetical protein